MQSACWQAWDVNGREGAEQAWVCRPVLALLCPKPRILLSFNLIPRSTCCISTSAPCLEPGAWPACAAVCGLRWQRALPRLWASLLALGCDLRGHKRTEHLNRPSKAGVGIGAGCLLRLPEPAPALLRRLAACSLVQMHARPVVTSAAAGAAVSGTMLRVRLGSIAGR